MLDLRTRNASEDAVIVTKTTLYEIGERVVYNDMPTHVLQVFPRNSDGQFRYRVETPMADERNGARNALVMVDFVLAEMRDGGKPLDMTLTAAIAARTELSGIVNELEGGAPWRIVDETELQPL